MKQVFSEADKVRLGHLFAQNEGVAGLFILILHLHGLLDGIDDADEIVLGQNLDKFAVFAALVYFKVDALPVEKLVGFRSEILDSLKEVAGKLERSVAD